MVILLLLIVLLGAPASAAGAGDWGAKLLPAPPFPEAAPSAPAQGPAQGKCPCLEPVSSKPNEITDEDAWFTRNGLTRPDRDPGSLPEDIPRQFRDATLVRAFTGGDSLFLLYGKDFGDLRYLIAADPKTFAFKYGYDFQRWQHPPGENGEFTNQRVLWAVERDGTLYVSHGHSTYAKDSGGRNAYLTAIDPKTDEILWRSPSLVTNANTFVVLDDVIVSGYGFTAEPDFLYLIDRKKGEIVARQPVKTGPEQILLRDGLLYVRCYNTDEVFRVRP